MSSSQFQLTAPDISGISADILPLYYVNFINTNLFYRFIKGDLLSTVHCADLRFHLFIFDQEKADICPWDVPSVNATIGYIQCWNEVKLLTLSTRENWMQSHNTKNTHHFFPVFLIKPEFLCTIASLFSTRIL